MKHLKSIISRFAQPLVFMIWLVTLFMLLFDEQYTIFLRPAFAWILILAVGILFGFLRVHCNPTKRPPFGLTEALRLLILVLPLLYLTNVKGISLDSYAFARRSLGLPSLPNTSSQQNRINHVDPLDNSVQQVTLADLYRNPQHYIGKRIQLTGRYHPGDTSTKALGTDTCLIFRFAVNCCAADATPLAVLVQLDQGSSTIKESDWVDAEGLFSIRTQGNQEIPMLNQATLCPVPEPQSPYLF